MLQTAILINEDRRGYKATGKFNFSGTGLVLESLESVRMTHDS